MPVQLPENMPVSIARLPRDRHGYPIPWFVAVIDGVPDFRIASEYKMHQAVRRRLCWICGESNLMGPDVFLIGSMCAVNRVSAEPPSHLVCAQWAAQACPFLSTPRMVRRDTGLPEGITNAAGMPILRNPGVTVAWLVRPQDWSMSTDGNGGLLFNVGRPRRMWWYAEARQATADEIQHSIITGLDLLYAAADEEGPDARAELDQLVEEAMKLLPKPLPQNT